MVSSSNLRILVAVVVTAIVVVVIFVVPLPFPFSFSINNPGSFSSATCYSAKYANGASISFNWHTSDGSSVGFGVVDSNSHVVYAQDAASGAGSFTANGNTYQYCAYDWSASSISVHGTADQPTVAEL